MAALAGVLWAALHPAPGPVPPLPLRILPLTTEQKQKAGLAGTRAPGPSGQAAGG